MSKEGGGGVFGRLKRGLSKTRQALTGSLGDWLGGKQAALDDLEDALLMSDVGLATCERLVKDLKDARVKDADGLRDRLRKNLLDSLKKPDRPENHPSDGPRVIVFVGVNGTGKTTTIGKLAARFQADGASPVLVACDTFRAAAIDQLGVWSERSGVPLVKQAPGADPASVLHDGLERARQRGESPVLVDTAGRLQAKTHLMDELAKMGRVASRLVPGSPHEAWLVLDATTGQNGLSQAREFSKAIPLTGVILTKLDGTAKGGIAFAIASELELPIRMVGVGEGIDDLLPFDPEAFVDGLLGAEAVGLS
ncbi:MAG: signal recognition particle-docking protein FtsY [Acidobacteriota bacterium]